MFSVDVTLDMRVEAPFNESDQLALFEQILLLAQQDPDGFIDDYDTLAGSLVLGDSECLFQSCANNAASAVFLPPKRCFFLIILFL